MAKLKVFNDLRCTEHNGGFGSMQRLTRRFLDVDNVPAADADVGLFWNDAITTPEEIRAFPRKKVVYLSANYTKAFSGHKGSYFGDWLEERTRGVIDASDATSHTSYAHRQFVLQYVAPQAATKPFCVFPPMYDPAVFHPAPMRHSGLRVVATALWRDWHRWITIFQSFAVVLRKVPSAKLIMGGGYMCAETNRKFPCNDVPYQQRSLAEEYHILDAIEWRQPTVDGFDAQNQVIAETYRQGNVFVHAYFADWGTFTCIEALASGLPVVCGDNGGLPEFAGDCAFIYKYGAGYDAPTMPPPNPTEVAAKILEAYAGGDALKERCIARAKQFEAENVCRGLQQFLEGVAHA